jgi:hypothetical protein
MPNRRAITGVGYLVTENKLANLKNSIPWLLNLNSDFVQLRPLVDVGDYASQKNSREMQGIAFSTDLEKWREHYGWIMEAVKIMDGFEDDPRLNTSRKKFLDLYGGYRTYSACRSTSLSGAIGTQGEVWLCVNHRQITQIGDLKRESLWETFGNRNPILDDLSKCRLLCRNHNLNKSLDEAVKMNLQDLPSPNPNIKHLNFI